jgi:hypothetical protein
VTNFEALDELDSLTNLSLPLPPDLADLGFVAALGSVSLLHLFECVGVRDFSALMEMPALEQLGVWKCQHLPQLPPLDRVTGLFLGQIQLAKAVAAAGPLLPQLKELAFEMCSGPADLSPLARSQLAMLTLRACEISDLRSLTCPPSLRSIGFHYMAGELDLGSLPAPRGPLTIKLISSLVRGTRTLGPNVAIVQR